MHTRAPHPLSPRDFQIPPPHIKRITHDQRFPLANHPPLLPLQKSRNFHPSPPLIRTPDSATPPHAPQPLQHLRSGPLRDVHLRQHLDLERPVPIVLQDADGDGGVDLRDEAVRREREAVRGDDADAEAGAPEEVAEGARVQDAWGEDVGRGFGVLDGGALEGGLPALELDLLGDGPAVCGQDVRDGAGGGGEAGLFEEGLDAG